MHGATRSGRHGHEQGPTRPRRGRWSSALAVVVVAALTAGCGASASTKSSTGTTAASSSSTGQTPRNGGSLVVAVDAETDSWNAATAEWAAAGSLVGSSVLEPLAKLNAKGGADPYLATSWIADATFDKWQINLRPGVTFQDGEPFDAAAVKLNIDTYVGGALSGQVLKPMIRSVDVTGPLTVVVNMTQPWAAFPSSYLDGGAALMMAPAMIHSADGGGTHPIGTGPFVFESWTPGGSFVVKRNPTYWQKGLPHLDSIEFRVLTDEATRVAALQSGDVNMILTTNAADANRLAGSYTVVKDWSTEVDQVQINTVASVDGVANPLSNAHARLALAYATDRNQVAKTVGNGVQTATSPWSPSSVWGLPQSQNGWVGYDQTKAKSEVAAYEQDTGATSLTITLTGLASTDEIRSLQALQAQWRKVGINTNIQTMDQVALIKKLVASQFEAVFESNPNYSDPDNDYVFWSSSTANGVGQININFSLYKNPQIDADLATGRTNGYPAQRKAAYDDLVHQLNAAAVDDWLYYTPYSLVANHNVRGLDTPRTVSFGNYEPKTWLGEIWLAN